MSIRRVIVAEAKRLDLSGRALARLAEIPERMVQRFIAGERDITTRKADALLTALEIQLRTPRTKKGS